LKNFLAATARHSLWPIRRLSSRPPTLDATDVLGNAAAGIVAGIVAAVVFLLGSLVLPARVALLMALCVALFAAIPRASLACWGQPLTAKAALALGVLVLVKLEILSEVDLAWIPVTLICSAAWARAAVLAATPTPVIGITATSGATRAAVVVIGLVPLCFFGVWPQPVWGLWVASLTTLLAARWIKAQAWAAPISVRWAVIEALYCLVVLLLMSAAALTEMVQEEAPGS
jgi:hypothetical protein